MGAVGSTGKTVIIPCCGVYDALVFLTVFFLDTTAAFALSAASQVSSARVNWNGGARLWPRTVVQREASKFARVISLRSVCVDGTEDRGAWSSSAIWMGSIALPFPLSWLEVEMEGVWPLELSERSPSPS